MLPAFIYVNVFLITLNAHKRTVHSLSFRLRWKTTRFRKTNMFTELHIPCIYIAVHTNVMKPKYFSNTLVAALLTAGPAATSQHCLQVARPVIRHVGLSRDRRGSTAVCIYSGSRQLSNRRTRHSQSSAE